MGIIVKQLRALGCPLWGCVGEPVEQHVRPAPSSALPLPALPAVRSPVESAQHSVVVRADDTPMFDEGTGKRGQLRLWLYVSDCGPDQVLMRKCMRHQAACQTDVMLFDVNCMMHQLQLIVKAMLARVDERLARLGRRWRYFGSVAQVMHW